jgi:hypothetical protein
MRKTPLSLLFFSFSMSLVQANEPLPWEKAQLECSTEHFTQNFPDKSQITCEEIKSSGVQDLCHNPKKFCDNIRKTEASQFLKNYHDSKCRPYIYWSKEQLNSEEGAKKIGKILRERIDRSKLPTPDFEFVGHEEGIYQGESWEKAKEQFKISKSVLLEYLKNLSPAAPEIVISTIEKTNIMDPYDKKIPLEFRQHALGNCGSDAETIGDYNAFADFNGYVTVCPKILLATQGENLLTLFLHEISHQLGPCLMANQMITYLTPPECDLSKSEDKRIQDIGSWIGRLHELEECFLDAGLNKGSDDKWLGKKLDQLMSKEAKEDPTKCLSKGSEFKISKDPFKGTSGYCDHSNAKTIILLTQIMNQLEVKNKMLKMIGKVQSKITELKIKIPDANQFNEGHADWLAGRLLPKAIGEWNKLQKNKKNSNLPEDIASELSLLCSNTKDYLLKGEAHPLDQRRMEIFLSQTDLREMLGCEGKPKQFSRKMNKCSE